MSYVNNKILDLEQLLSVITRCLAVTAVVASVAKLAVGSTII